MRRYRQRNLDEEYVQAGAELVPDAASVFRQADMIIKVKEPIEPEYHLLREGQILYHLLAPGTHSGSHQASLRSPGHRHRLRDHHRRERWVASADPDVGGRRSHGCDLGCVLPARRLWRAWDSTLWSSRGSTERCGYYRWRHRRLELSQNGSRLGARVTILETSLDRMRWLDNIFHGALTTLASNHHNLMAALHRADLLIGAVLIPGASAPKLVTRPMLKVMKPGAVIVDVAVDQGGCFETTHATTHSDPIYEVDGIIHYCVANMPGAVPRTSTFALNNATILRRWRWPTRAW